MNKGDDLVYTSYMCIFIFNSKYLFCRPALCVEKKRGMLTSVPPVPCPAM